MKKLLFEVTLTAAGFFLLNGAVLITHSLGNPDIFGKTGSLFRLPVLFL
ncbi:MAG: hypothetical protein IJ010_05735 [Ruminococcus sp.]|nr:hypothetical protein [Ruminococcus sp.]